MNLLELRQQYPQYDDLSDQELLDSFHEKYYSDIPKEDFYRELGVSPSQPPASGQNAPPAANSLAQRVAPWVKGAAEAAGTLGGGLMGSALGPVTGLAGAGLGYAGGKQLGNLYEQFVGLTQPPAATANSLARGALDVGKDVVTGAGMEATGGILGKGLGMLVKPLGRAAEGLYGTVLKPSTTLAPAQRQALLRQGVQEQVLPSEKGLGQLRQKITAINEQISRLIASGGDKPVDMSAVARNIDELKNRFSALPAGEKGPFIKKIDQIKNLYLGEGETLSAKKAQQMKQQLYGLIRGLRKQPYGRFQAVPVEARKQVARGLREELERQYPEIGALNAKDKALIDLERELQRAVGRLSNREFLGLPEYIGAGAGTVGGVGGIAGGLALAKLVRMPSVAARIAFALNKASQVLAKDPGVTRRIATRVLPFSALRETGEEQRWKSLGDEY